MSLTLDKILAASPATTRGQPTQLSSDPKGERIAYASGKSIFVRNIDNPSLSKQYTAHTTTTTCARFSPSGFYIASGDVSGTIRIWDSIEAETTKGTYQLLSGRINDVAWDADSQRVIAVGDGRERFGHVITADSGNGVGEVSGHSKPVNGVAMRPGRPLRAATVGDDGSLCFLHGAPFKFAAKSSGLHKGFVYGVAYSPDGNSIVSVGADGRIQLYDGKSGEATKSFGDGGGHAGSIFAVSWGADGKKIVTAGADQTVRMWDVESGKEVYKWRLGPEGVVNAGDQQVGVVWPQGRKDGLIISLSLSGDLNYFVEGKTAPIKVVQGHNKAITALSTSAGDAGKDIWSGSFDGKVCHWDPAGTGTVVGGTGHTNQVTHFAADNTSIYSIGWDDTLRAITPSARTFKDTSQKLEDQPKGLGILEKGLFAFGTPSGIAIASAVDSILSRTALKYTLTALAVNNKTLAAADDTDVRIYTLASDNKSTETTKLTKQGYAVTVMAFSPNGTYLAVGTSNGRIYVYKTSDWSLFTDRWAGHTATVKSIAWNIASTHAASGSIDTHVFVWSTTKLPSRVVVRNAHKDGVSGVCWVDSQSKIATAGGDAAVKLWSVPALQ